MRLSDPIVVESLVPDADAAATLAVELFGSAAPQPRFAIESDERGHARDVVLGATVVRFVQPLGDGARAEFLATRGPDVRSILAAVEDLDTSREELDRAGIGHRVSGAFRAEDAGLDSEVVTVSTRAVLGYDLELVAAPQIVADGPAGLWDGAVETAALSPIIQYESTVPDADAAVGLLVDLFGSREVEQHFAGVLSEINPVLHIRHALLGDEVAQLCQPVALLPGFSWCDQLEATGAGLHNLTFLVPSMADTMARFEKAGIEPLIKGPIPWELVIDEADVRPDVDDFCLADTVAVFGFHLELTERWTDKQLGVLHKPVWGMS